MPLALKPYPRLPGAELAITGESHVIGEDTPNLVWLDEVPLQSAGVSILGYTEVTSAPAAGEFRVFYTGLLASAIEFNPADTGLSASVNYTGQGGTVTVRDYNRVATAVNDLEAAQADLTELEAAVATLQTDVGTLQTDVAAAQASVVALSGNVSAVESSLETVQEDVQTVYDTQQSMATTLTGVQATVAGLQTSVAALTTGLDAVETEIAAIPDTYVAKNQEIEFDTTGALISYASDAENVAPFQMTIDRFDNPVGDRHNNVTRWGYNIAPGGGPIDSNNHAVAIEIESFFRPQTTQLWTEAHLAFRTKGGRLWRPWSMESDVDAGDPGTNAATSRVRMRLEGDWIGFKGRNSGARMTLDEGGLIFYEPIPIRQYNNNQSMLEQVNAAGNHWVPVVRVNASDRVELGNASTPTEVPGGVVLLSPNGTRYIISVSNTGVLSAATL